MSIAIYERDWVRVVRSRQHRRTLHHSASEDGHWTLRRRTQAPRDGDGYPRRCSAFAVAVEGLVLQHTPTIGVHVISFARGQRHCTPNAPFQSYVSSSSSGSSGENEDDAPFLARRVLNLGLLHRASSERFRLLEVHSLRRTVPLRSRLCGSRTYTHRHPTRQAFFERATRRSRAIGIGRYVSRISRAARV